MPTYYVDPAASGLNDGTSWTDAWQTLQRAIDGTGGTQPVAGDVVLCRGTETVTTMIDYDGNDGSSTGGYITFRGVNASGVNDGTRYKLDASGQTLSAILRPVKVASDSPLYIAFENFELADNTGDGVSVANYTASSHWHWHNCYIHGNSADGMDIGTSAADYWYFTNCRFEDNGGCGVAGAEQAVFAFCTFKGNTSDGLQGPGFGNVMSVVYQCLITGNGGMGVNPLTNVGYHLIECTIDNNTGDNFEPGGGSNIVLGCRMTESGAYGIDCDALTIVGYTYMPDALEARDNASGNIETTGAPYVDLTGTDGASTNDLAGTDASGGYENPTTDYTLTSTATKRSQEVTLDGTTKAYIAAGLSVQTTGGGGGGSTIITRPRRTM